MLLENDTLPQERVMTEPPRSKKVAISVVVPFYNAESYIEKTIRGLLSQDLPSRKFEIIMVDNNSRDDSAEIVKRYPQIKLLSESKQGSYAARNRGLRQATGEKVAFIDADCVPFPGWLQRINNTLNEVDVNVVVGSRRLANDSPILALMAAYEHEKNTYVFNGKDRELFYGYTNNMAVHRKFIRDLDMFIERHRGSDTIFVRKVVERYGSASVRYEPKMMVRHLEIDSLKELYRKIFIYGRSRRKYRRIMYVRPLSNTERLVLFRRTVRNHNVSPARATVLFSLLSIGLLYWSLGSVSALLPSRS